MPKAKPGPKPKVGKDKAVSNVRNMLKKMDMQGDSNTGY